MGSLSTGDTGLRPTSPGLGSEFRVVRFPPEKTGGEGSFLKLQKVNEGRVRDTSPPT